MQLNLSASSLFRQQCYIDGKLMYGKRSTRVSF